MSKYEVGKEVFKFNYITMEVNEHEITAVSPVYDGYYQIDGNRDWIFENELFGSKLEALEFELEKQKSKIRYAQKEVERIIRLCGLIAGKITKEKGQCAKSMT